MSDFKSKYPNVTPFRKTPTSPERLRFQKSGLTTRLFPAELVPFTPEFDAFYESCKAPRPQAEVVRLPTAAASKTFRAAWRLVLDSLEWADLDPKTQQKNEWLAGEFLATPINEGEPLLWGDELVAEMAYPDLVALVKRWMAKTPSKPWHMKTMLTKLFREAIRMGWVNGDPLGSVTWKRGGNKGTYFGHKAWPDRVRAQFEARHPIGSAARTCYALALYTSLRRGDIAALTWDQLTTVKEADGTEVEVFVFEQQKQVQSDEDMVQVRPLTTNEELSEALAPLDRVGSVLKNAWGKPYKNESLSAIMRMWMDQAGIEPGYSLHGLRKSHAAILAASGATPQEQKNALGHTTTQQQDYYARSVDKQVTTISASRKVSGKFRLSKS